MKNKRNVLVIILVILALLGICGGLFIHNKSNDEPKEDYFYDYPNDQTKVIDICKKKEGCVVPEKNRFYVMTVKDEYSDLLKKAIKEINNESAKYYSEVNDSPECPNARDLYYHSKYVDIQVVNYENDKYISITPIYTVTNLCDMKVSRPSMKTYLFDKKANKMISQEEFIETEDITEAEIIDAIKENNELVKEEENIEIPEEQSNDYIVYFAFDGSISVAYKIEALDMYYFTSVK